MQRVLDAPGEAHSWHALFDWAWFDRARRQAANRFVIERVPDVGLAGYLRATWLLVMDGERPEWLERMALRLEPEVPGFGGRLMLLIQLSGYLLMVRGETHHGYRALIDRMRMAAALERAAAPLTGTAPRTDAVGAVRRVALVIPMLGRLEHPPSRLLFDHARLLRGMGIEVAVFTPQEGRSTSVGDHGPTPRLAQPVTHDPKAWEEAFGSSVAMWTGDAAHPIERRWSDMLSQLERFQPDSALIVGVITPLHWMLWPRYPLVALPGVGVPPLGPADVWLCSRPQDVPAVHDADPRRPLPVRYAARSFAPSPSPGVRQRSELGLGLRATVLLTVGTALSTEIQGPWAQAMVGLLKAHPNLFWLLVGEAKVPPALAAVSQRLRVLPYQQDLAALMPLADVYVNPPRPGGGVSVAMAMALGVPALAFAGTDGGDKLGDMALPDQETYLRTLEQMVLLPEERAQWARREKLRFTTELDLGSAQPALQQALDAAVERFNRRR